MEPKLNPDLKRLLSNPEIGNKFTNEILANNNKVSPINIVLEDYKIEVELIPIGYTGKNPFPETKK
jgi:hypothetical protein